MLDAAILGITFWSDAVGAMGAVEPERLAAALEDLRRRSIVEPRSDDRLPGHDAYAFTHALIQEEAYGRLARADRARKHLEAAALARVGGRR